MNGDGIHVTQRPKVWPVAGAFGRALLLVLLAWAVAGAIAGLSYLVPGLIGVPIVLGILMGVGFLVAVIALHRAYWLAFLALVPGLLVLIGAVQHAPEAVLEQRGVRERVTVVTEEVTGRRHHFELRTAGGEVLDERLASGLSSPPYEVGDTLAIIRDPEGVVPLMEAADVDASEKRGMLIMGASGWTLIALYAVRRGHVRRRHGKTLRKVRIRAETRGR
jgi:hypothetical protein